ncbi:MAG: stage 0 sporulation family protein [Candidatus Omnitrophica bacterium]|nr:stage 0 sporulation family protein [Candidatus Omnitrophota bacterium]MDD5351940.1 stage 0 sporulation family protein [Candidatus Omnitrophota bacterium]MDD5550766.1 stage 0 sporulation family protein [Candidatus Omnitrophota bacterium]
MEIAQVRLRESNNVAWYKINNLTVKTGDYVIVEAERGIDYGQINSDALKQEQTEESLKPILRIATPDDLRQIEENRKKAKDSFDICLGKIGEHKLNMKLVSCEYSFDRSKILFYFTADNRVDFRNLVKDLARIFKARIEMRQIGVRDEAKLFGGFGPCGRELCCSKFLKDFEPVTIKMAKGQGLPVNLPKISGLCGRLMCCLSYEYECYRQLCKDLPREGDKIDTPQGKGKVISVSALRKAVLVEIADGKRIEIIYNKQ